MHQFSADYSVILIIVLSSEINFLQKREIISQVIIVCQFLSWDMLKNNTNSFEVMYCK